jgi:diguanylate cyclase (GGDEF)-like protein
MRTDLDQIGDGSQPVILIIDDDAAGVRLIIRWLHDAGYRVSWAEDGHTGLNIAEKYRPDAILLDVDLPGLDGVSVCKELKGRLNTADIPVLFITGQDRNDALISRTFGAGGNDLLFKPASKVELFARLHSVLQAQQLREAYRRLAVLDTLTGLSNRRQFFIDITGTLMIAKRDRREAYLILADIDQLAAINERYGHDFGDEVILTFSRLIKRLISPTCKAGRIGGEEFGILLLDYKADLAIALAQRLRQTLASIAFDADSEPKHFHAGFGVARFVGTPEQFSADQFLNEADIALFAAKELGRGRVTAFWSLDPTSLPVVAPTKRHARSRDRKRTQRSFIAAPSNESPAVGQTAER